ncbi:MAG: cytidylyltransferase domain-containing protein, partial [Planctomycetota bacterium]
MSAVAILPARGGSKRIPRKNIRPLHGVPLIVRAITILQRAGRFDRIVVSTDDEEIAGIAGRA